MDDLISLTEAADLIGKNLRTIQRYLKEGRLSRHPKDGKNFVSKEELESKFSLKKTAEIKKPGTPEPEETIRKGEKGVKKAKVEKDDGNFWQNEARDYQKKWTDEIQNHAQTKEELGEWKGRAEAYQAFAIKLLTPGKTAENQKDDIVVENQENIASPKTFNFWIVYVAIGILFIITIFLFISIKYDLINF